MELREVRGEAMAKQRLAGCPAKHHDAWHVDVVEVHQEAMLSVLQWLKACLTGAQSMSGKYQNGYTRMVVRAPRLPRRVEPVRRILVRESGARLGSIGGVRRYDSEHGTHVFAASVA